MARGGRVSDLCHCELWPPGPVGEGLGRDEEVHGSRRAGTAPAPQSRARSLPDGFTKPVGPAGPREGGSGRESQSRGRGQTQVTATSPLQLWEEPEQAAFGVGGCSRAMPQRGFGAGGFSSAPATPSWPSAWCLCPVPPSCPPHSPYILPSSERMIFLRPQGG